MVALGLTGRGLWALNLLETGLIGAIAGVCAVPTGLVLAAVLTYVINLRSFGWTIQWSVDPWILLQAIAIGVAAALLAGVYPIRRLARMSVVEGLRQGVKTMAKLSISLLRYGAGRRCVGSRRLCRHRLWPPRARLAVVVRRGRYRRRQPVKTVSICLGRPEPTPVFARGAGAHAPLSIRRTSGRIPSFRPSGGTTRAIWRRPTGGISATS